MSKDSIGDRMKSQYEHRARYTLPRRTYTIIRVDGKAFHSFTRGLERPFDTSFMEWMDYTAKVMCEQIQGTEFAFVQSDEISLLLTDFATIQTDAWFDGNIQKMASVSASIATAYFNACQLHKKIAMFDGRVFTIPDPTEVENYFIWRQQDATRNAIQMAGQAKFSHKRLQGVNCNQIQEMLFQEFGINFNELPAGFKRGRIIKRTEAGSWEVDKPPVFTQERPYISDLIPRYEQAPVEPKVIEIGNES